MVEELIIKLFIDDRTNGIQRFYKYVKLSYIKNNFTKFI